MSEQTGDGGQAGAGGGGGDGNEAPFWADRLVHAVGAAHVMSENGRALVRPGAPAELVDVMRIAGEVGAAVGIGLGAHNAGGIDVDLSRMCNVLYLDETSLTVTVQCGITVEALEHALGERSLTLGAALPPWSRTRTLGALLAAPRASEASPRTGRFLQSCIGVQALLPDGTEISTRLAPRKATGPDLMHVVLGGRGTLGILSAATVRVQRRQESRAAAAFKLPTLPAALSTARKLIVVGGRPADLAVSGTGTLWLEVDGPAALVAAEVALAERIAREHGGEPVPQTPPPRIKARPHERAVPLETVDSAVLASSLVGDSVRVIAWHPAGACVVDSARAPEPPPADAPALVAALKRRLDPNGRLVAWPGAV
ncbi:MAG: linked oxidase domain protein [Myxococcales bacterium]|nr:linked oxidase domain protein [Myxococcales bacterium]